MTLESEIIFNFEATYYLSGPMAGYKENNFPAFESAARDLRAFGVKIFSPHEVKQEGGMMWADYLAADISGMLEAKCTGIILLRGWPSSKGAWLELQIAVALGFPVYYFDAKTFVLIDMNRGAS